MMSYEKFLDEPIGITRNNFMRREDYYKKFMANTSPRDFYDQLVKIEKEKK